MGFPDGNHSRHPNFVAIATGNTWGHGANRDYIGRNPLDKAFLDRFGNLAWDYDEAFETKLAKNPAWSSRVQKIRKAVFELKEQIVVSPRASIFGAKMLAAGEPQEIVENMLIFNGIAETSKNKILALCN
jgi:MoxR-like ATPase